MFGLTQNKRRLTSTLLLVLFVGYFAGITFFPHKHIINNQVVVHSHPFSGSESHTHTTSAINLLVQLSGFATKLLAAGISLVLYLITLSTVSKTYTNTYTQSNYQLAYFLRPPPVVA